MARKVAQGHYRLLVGARSAIFAPIPNLGLIVVDEEHAESYKQSDPAPRYHARDVAVVRARQCNAVCLLGSATPSCESYQNACDGRYTLLTLKRRAKGRFMPLVRIVDLSVHNCTDRDSWITDELAEALVKTIRAGDKAIVFLNRRGYATMVACKECGHAATCPDCSLTLTYHAKDRSYQCHLCTYRIPAWERCPKCNSANFLFRGAGTQKIEEKLASLDSSVRLARLDSDISAKRGAAEAILAGFAADEFNLLVGTQMVAKGLDVAKVGLVGVIWADQHMAFPDFRAEERTFQLLTQVAGRAGRGAGAAGRGEVIVQTFRPDHELIELAAAQNAGLFFERELPSRKALLYPPFSHLVLLSFAASDASKARGAAQSFAAYWNDPARQVRNPAGRILGPAPAAVPKRAGRHVFHVLVKAMAVKKIWHIIYSFRTESDPLLRRDGVILTLDVDPTDFW
jgi:primosomal protein N' (replication factor Y)